MSDPGTPRGTAASPAGPVVRPARHDDTDAVAAIYDHWVRTSTATFELEPPGVGHWHDRLDALGAAGWPFLVVEADGAVAGFAYVGPWRTRPAYAATVEDTLYLHPDATGRGLGTLLLTALLDRAAAAGAREVVAVVADAETPASLALHRRAGFVEAGRLERVGRKFDRWLGTTLLQRSLVAGTPGPRPGQRSEPPVS
ncbi:GNAT family N-acetyltransferase [Cellulomonas endophytica]|uniref:GNAT family N-acetyltransferase n=1 Tax=Cellulomonas endophytica TaxID=2494735 RepID=UPI001F0CC9BC|nr:GNAT family N-acetyltransferase [Cellulomonas endophytica]